MPPYRPRPAAALAAVLPLLLLAPSVALADNVVKPAWIDAFSGWAGPGGGFFYARVHKGAPVAKPKPHESTLKRLKETVEALEVNALEHATVSIAGVPGLTSAKADDHGFLKVRLPGGLRPGLLPVTLRVATPGYGSSPALLRVQVFADAPGLGVISDIDDTLTDTGVTHKLRLLANTLFHSTWELKTFPGAPQAVTTVAGKQGAYPLRSLFYLSGSPWGLHSRIADFFDRAGFPRGAMILRRYSQESLNAYDYKLPHLRELFAAFPKTRWLLLGDSGEKDPEVYAQLRRERPGNVERIYIHMVTKEKTTSARFAGMTAFKDWNDVVRDAQAHGYGAGAAAVTRGTGTR